MPTYDELLKAGAKPLDVPAKTAETVKKDGYIPAALRSFGQGFYGGGYDELVGGLETAGGLLGDYRGRRDELRDIEKETSRQYPITSGTAKLAGLIAGPGKFIKGAKQVAALGGAMGALGSEGDLTKGQLGPVAADSAVGAAEALAGYGLLKAPGKIKNLPPGKVADFAKSFIPGSKLLDRAKKLIGLLDDAGASTATPVAAPAAAAENNLAVELLKNSGKAASDADALNIIKQLEQGVLERGALRPGSPLKKDIFPMRKSWTEKAGLIE